ncbi:hypothetical protein BH10ACT6_BH10ACT6_02130 [soil metagenome]
MNTDEADTLFAALGMEHRSVIVLAYFGGPSIAEVAREFRDVTTVCARSGSRCTRRG